MVTTKYRNKGPWQKSFFSSGAVQVFGPCAQQGGLVQELNVPLLVWSCRSRAGQSSPVSKTLEAIHDEQDREAPHSAQGHSMMCSGSGLRGQSHQQLAHNPQCRLQKCWTIEPRPYHPIKLASEEKPATEQQLLEHKFGTTIKLKIVSCNLLNTKMSVRDRFQKAGTHFLPDLCILDATPETIINIGIWKFPRFFNLDQILPGKQLSWFCFINPYLQYIVLESIQQVRYKLLMDNHLKTNVCVWMSCSIPASPFAPVGVLHPSSCHSWEGHWISTPIRSSCRSCPWKG